MSARDEDMLEELKNISFLLGDLNQIRHGHYEPPRGAEEFPREPNATTDDVYQRLLGITGHLERMNQTLYNIGLVLCENEDYWHRLNRQ